MLDIIRLIKGYILVAFFGEDNEKLFNACAAAGINLWNTSYSNGKMIACIDISSFKQLNNLRKGLQVKIKILEKHGVRFITDRYKYRYGLFAGLALFFALIKFFSLYIWDIEVVGNKNIKTAEILSNCRSIGIYEGVRSDKINAKNDIQKLLLKTEGIAWGSLNIEGCRLTVNVSERSEVSGEKNRPSNIKALYDGTVTGVTATSGEVLVKPGDNVKKGDILISGITQKMNSNVFMHSSGEVTAKTKRLFKMYMPYTKKVKRTNGKIRTKRVFSFFNINMPLYFGKLNDIKVFSTDVNRLSLFGKKLPCAVFSLKYKEYKQTDITNSEEKIVSDLRNKIEKEIKSKNMIGFSFSDEQIIKSESGITLIQNYNCEEIISYEEEIIIDTAN